MEHAGTNPLGVEWFGLVMGLGFVLSFGYWCTDFLVVQRAMAADSMTSARRTPLIAAVPKMFFPFLVILPGLIAIALPTVRSPSRHRQRQDGAAATVPAIQGIIPAKVDYWSGKLELDKNGQLVARLRYGHPAACSCATSPPACWAWASRRSWPASCRAWRATSRRSTRSGPMTSTRPTSTPARSDRHYLWMGRFATLFGTVVSIAAAYLASRFNNIMDALQLVFGFVNAPLFATFLLGMFWKRATGHGAFAGLLCRYGCRGDLPRPEPAGGAVRPASRGAGSPLPDQPGLHVSHRDGPELLDGDLRLDDSASSSRSSSAWSPARGRTRNWSGLVYALTDKPQEGHLTWYQRPLALGVIVLLMTVALNFLFY